ncbi:MAG TPA: Gfo/Idh/MocA family oxidoreductase [Polyangiaceae bacterium]|nr:Gfo/Idh/MocA family oxidoreductase [Polyangiaceae bacterium]
MSAESVRIAIVGAGRWGRNLARAFASAERCSVTAVCDVDPQALAAPCLAQVPVRTTDFSALLRDPAITALAIASPPHSHARQAIQGLEAGKHVFVEKPMALGAADALRMREAAARSNRRLMVGHLMRYHPGVAELRRLVEAGTLGELRRAIAVRSGPGTTSSEEGPWWALAPHDLSLLFWLFKSEITALSAARRSTASGGTEVAARVRLGSASAELVAGSGQKAKMRRLLVAGTRRAAVFDDGGPSPTLTLLDAKPSELEKLREQVLSDAPSWEPCWAPEEVAVEGDEPLLREASHFVAAILEGGPIATDADEGCRVVAALEAGSVSMQSRGRWVRVAGSFPQAMSRTA